MKHDKETLKEFVDWFRSIKPYKGMIADHEGVVEGKSLAITPPKMEMILQIFSEWEEIAKLKAKLERAEQEAEEFRKCASGFVGSTVRMAEELWANTKSQEWIKNKLLSHPSFMEIKSLFKKYNKESLKELEE